MVPRRSVITVGNFDGVHHGHRALIDAARRMADRAEGAADVLVLTFTEHPLTVLRPDKAPLKLMDNSQRMAALLEAGADRIEWLQPEQAILGLAPQQFVERIVEKFRPIGWVEGPDFRFGRNRSGDVQLLRSLGSDAGFEVRIIDPVHLTLRDKVSCPVGSSLIRWLIAQGRIADATLCLGRPLTIRGPVVEGEKRGRTIGFPTANLTVPGRQLPGDGVYAGAVTLDGTQHLAAISVGSKPTFGANPTALEAYVLDWSGDLYGQTLELSIVRWIRDQWPFPSVQSLTRQMDRDIEQIRRLHRLGLLDPTGIMVAAA